MPASRFDYCRSVLMRHWTMTCDHVGRPPVGVADTSGKWREIDEVDPVRAILIKNE